MNGGGRALSTVIVVLALGSCGDDSAPLDVAPLDVAGTRLVDRPLLVSEPTIVGLDDGFAIAWIGREPGEALDRIWYARARSDGSIVVPAAPIESAGAVEQLVLVSRGTDLVAVWSEESPANAIWAAAFGLDGTITQAPVEVVQIGSRRGVTAAVASGKLVVSYVTSAAQINVQPLAADLSTSGPPVVIAVAAQSQDNPCLLEDAGELVLLFDQSGTIRSARLGSGGNVLVAPAPIGSGVSAQCAGGPGGGMASWFRSSPPRSDLARLEAGAWVVLPAVIPANRAASQSTAVARTGNTAVVTWEADADHATPQVWSGRLDLATLDPISPDHLTDPRFVFSQPAVATTQSSLGVAFVGELVGGSTVFLATTPW